MGRVQAASLRFQDRPLLGQMAIATVLVGSAAALSSAVIAVPVGKVGYGEGWSEPAPAAPQLAPAKAAAEAAPGLRISAPFQAPASVRVSTPAPKIAFMAPPASRDFSVRPAPMSRIEPAQLPGLAAPIATPLVSTPALVELAPAPVAAPVAALAIPSAPAVAFSAPPAELAVSALAPVAEVASPGEAARALEPAVPMRLINPPELRGFDLAKLSGPDRPVPAGFARPAAKSAISGKVEGLGKKDTVVGDAVFHQVTLVVAGSDGTAIDVRIGADMKPSIKVGDLLGLVSERMDPDSAARFAAAASAADYVSLATLRAAGFDVSYNAGADSISISAAQ